MNPSLAQRNIPGAPGGDGVIVIFLLIVPMIAVIQKFFSGIFQTAVAILPPGLRTRFISFKANSMSGKNINPKRQLTASNVSFLNGSSLTSQTIVSKFFIPLFFEFS